MAARCASGATHAPLNAPFRPLKNSCPFTPNQLNAPGTLLGLPKPYYKKLKYGNFTYYGEICGPNSGGSKAGGNQTLTLTVEVTGNVVFTIYRPAITATTATGASGGKPRGTSYENLLIQAATAELLQDVLGS